jgi:hypothetical protein
MKIRLWQRFADGLDGVVGGRIPPLAGFVSVVEGDCNEAAFWSFALERLELAAVDYRVVIEGHERAGICAPDFCMVAGSDTSTSAG